MLNCFILHKYSNLKLHCAFLEPLWIAKSFSYPFGFGWFTISTYNIENGSSNVRQWIPIELTYEYNNKYAFHKCSMFGHKIGYVLKHTKKLRHYLHKFFFIYYMQATLYIELVGSLWSRDIISLFFMHVIIFSSGVQN